MYKTILNNNDNDNTIIENTFLTTEPPQNIIPFLELSCSLSTNNLIEKEIIEIQKKKNDEKTLKNMKYKSSIQPVSNINETNISQIEQILDNETKNNKSDTWSKLDKMLKTQLLHNFADKYGSDNGFSQQNINNLKTFFTDSIDRQKLQKAKEVVYNKDTKEITNIPSLFFNTEKKQFTLKITDPKRQSTLKSLTPKKTSIKNKLQVENTPT